MIGGFSQLERAAIAELNDIDPINRTCPIGHRDSVTRGGAALAKFDDQIDTRVRDSHIASGYAHAQHNLAAVVAVFDPVGAIATVKDITVVARAADQGVIALATRQGIGSGIAGDDVGLAVAGAAQCSVAGELEVLDVGTERPVDQ